MAESITIDDVAATLEYGYNFGKGMRRFFGITVIYVSCVAFLGYITAMVLIFFPAEREAMWAFFGIAGFGLFMLILCRFLLHPVLWGLQKNLPLWLKDAVKLYAYAKIIDKNVGMTGYKIEVTFGFNKRKYVKQSKHYSRSLYRFVDRKLQILYSPAYDQVVILRDETNRHISKKAKKCN